jgi:hypothetical protein
MIAYLNACKVRLGCQRAEVFPKQEILGTKENGEPELGNFIYLPYFGGDYTDTYGYDQNGETLENLEAFFAGIRYWDGEPLPEGEAETELPKRPEGIPVEIPEAHKTGIPASAIFPKGTRNKSLHAHLYMLRKRCGYGDELIKEIAPLLNKYKTTEPLDQAELSRMVGSLLKTPPGEAEQAWPVLAPAAFCGLAGTLVEACGPYSEADPAALLVQFLVLFGNMIGRNPGPRYRHVETWHHCNLFMVLVGSTAEGAKGVSGDLVKSFLYEVEPEWRRNLVGGFGSGEAIIYKVRDPIPATGKKQEDPGVTDKRLVVSESEWASFLQIAKREGTTTTVVMRNAWDSGYLDNTTKGSPVHASNAHISMVGHITPDELVRHLDSTEKANGFGNRVLWILARRSKELPLPDRMPRDVFKKIVYQIGVAKEFANKVAQMKDEDMNFERGEMAMSEEARQFWCEMYGEFTNPFRDPMVGLMTARGAPQAIRLAMIYAILDRSDLIDRPHLEAAMAITRYSEASVQHVFGSATGHPLADLLLKELIRNVNGLTRTELSAKLGRNRKAEEIDNALNLLEKNEKAHREEVPTAGRPVERWYAVRPIYTPAKPREVEVPEITNEQLSLTELKGKI